jgi:protein-S-isoprenylcysteine O-methyltransferase Ste14
VPNRQQSFAWNRLYFSHWGWESAHLRPATRGDRALDAEEFQMKKLAIALTAIVALIAPAFAADMAARAPLPAAPDAYAPSWTGATLAAAAAMASGTRKIPALSMVRRAFRSPPQQRRAVVVISGPWAAAATISFRLRAGTS